MSTIDLSGRRSIVTGASRGFGRAISVSLAASGADVVGVARNESALKALQRQLGSSFTPVVADVADDALAPRLFEEFRPSLVVLNAGATPRAATIQDHTWESFSESWNVDVRHVFEFVRYALRTPLDPGSSVVSISSGAARMGSPLSGGYAGAKATISFISSYAGSESERNGLGIHFVALLPKLTPATELGSRFVDAYAAYDHVDRDAYRERLGSTLSVDQVGNAVVQVAGDATRSASAYLLTADGLSELA